MTGSNQESVLKPAVETLLLVLRYFHLFNVLKLLKLEPVQCKPLKLPYDIPASNITET